MTEAELNQLAGEFSEGLVSATYVVRDLVAEVRRLREWMVAINDLAMARLRNPPLEANVEHDLKEIARLSYLAPDATEGGDHG
jgi:hypothetical protein